MLRIVTNCKRCGTERTGRDAAYKCCQRAWRSRPPVACKICGTECSGARLAYLHCQQRGSQRNGYAWRNYVPLDERLRQKCESIRADPFQMAEIHTLAVALLAGVI